MCCKSLNVFVVLHMYYIFSSVWTNNCGEEHVTTFCALFLVKLYSDCFGENISLYNRDLSVFPFEVSLNINR